MRPATALGVGVTYAPGLEPVLEAGAGLLDLVEIEPQVVLDPRLTRPERTQRLVEVRDFALQFANAVTAHCVVAPVGSSSAPTAEQCDRFTDISTALSPAMISEHLSANEVQTPCGPAGAGFLMPPHQTTAGVRRAIANIDIIMSVVDAPVLFETGVNYFSARSDEMPDGHYWRSVAEGADCGILLDLHNLWTNHLNGRADFETTLSQLPLDRVQELHLAGGEEFLGFWTDAHSGLASPELLGFARDLAPHLQNLRAIVFEIMPSRISQVPNFAERLQDQLREMRDIWDLRPATAPVPRSEHPADQHPADQHSADQHRVARYGPVSTQRFDVERQRILACATGNDQPGASGPSRWLYSTLIDSGRKSTLSQVTLCTIRSLAKHLGRDELEAFVERYLRDELPAVHALDEARQFLNYVCAAGYRWVPKLNQSVRIDRKLLSLDNTPPTQEELALLESLILLEAQVSA